MRSIDNAPFGGRFVPRRVVLARAGVPRPARVVFAFAPARAFDFVVGFFALPRALDSAATVLSISWCS
jgi:hypothetical protein